MDQIPDSAIFKNNDGVSFHCAPLNGSVHGIVDTSYAAFKLFFDDSDNPERWVRYISMEEARSIHTMLSLFLQLKEVPPLPLGLVQAKANPTPPTRVGAKLSEPLSRHGSSLSRQRANGKTLRAIAEAGVPISVHEIALLTNMPRSTVSTAVLYLYRMGRVQRDTDHSHQGGPFLYTPA
jgi:DNA-binding transcriptional ArsR family regulator